MDYTLDNGSVKLKKRCRTKSPSKTKSKLKWMKKNMNPFSVAYPFVPKIRHKSAKETDCFEETCKWVPFKPEVHKLIRNSIKSKIKGLKGHKINRNQNLLYKGDAESNDNYQEDQHILLTERIGDIRFEYRQKSQNKEPETPVKILRSSLTDDYHKLLSCPTSSIGFSRSNNYGFYTSSAHIYQRNKVRGSHNNINIDEFVLKQSDEGSYLDKFSESTKKTIHNEDIINKYVKSEAVYANTLNNDLVFSINSNPILSLDNFRVLNSNCNSRKNSKEKSNSKENILINDEENRKI